MMWLVYLAGLFVSCCGGYFMGWRSGWTEGMKFSALAAGAKQHNPEWSYEQACRWAAMVRGYKNVNKEA